MHIRRVAPGMWTRRRSGRSGVRFGRQCRAGFGILWKGAECAEVRVKEKQVAVVLVKIGKLIITARIWVPVGWRQQSIHAINMLGSELASYALPTFPAPTPAP